MGRHSKEEVFPMMERVVNGELSQSEFCEMTNLKVTSYHYWLRKYRNESVGKGSFVRVKTDNAREKSFMVEVIMSPGITIRFSERVSPQYLRALVAAE